METRLDALERENADLKLQLKMGKESEMQEHIESGRMLQELEAMLKEKARDEVITQKIKTIKERFGDSGRDRHAAVQHYLDQLERHLVPNQTTKMTLWTVQQEDKAKVRDDLCDTCDTFDTCGTRE